MGLIRTPTHRVYLDADGLSEFLDSDFQPNSLADKVANLLQDGAITFISSELILVEALVRAVRERDVAREETIRRFLRAKASVVLFAVDLSVLEAALELRAKHNLRTPDAIHLATGQEQGCAFYFTKDSKWMRAGARLIDLAGLANLTPPSAPG